jgi:hypothetical protein
MIGIGFLLCLVGSEARCFLGALAMVVANRLVWQVCAGHAHDFA